MSREARLKEQLREQLATAAADSKRQVGPHSKDSLAKHTNGLSHHFPILAHDGAPSGQCKTIPQENHKAVCRLYGLCCLLLLQPVELPS